MKPYNTMGCADSDQAAPQPSITDRNDLTFPSADEGRKEPFQASLTCEGTRRTERTEGTTHETQGDLSVPAVKPEENAGNISSAVPPIAIKPENLPRPIVRPEFLTHDDWFNSEGRACRPGLYYHGLTSPQGDGEPKPVDTWVCTPIHAIAMTATAGGESFGLLLRFIDSYGKWREWSVPMYLLKGSGEEMRGELLNLGVRMDIKNRALLPQWLMSSFPEQRLIAALQTGWHQNSFVLPQRTIGSDNVRFQSEHAAHNDFVTAGTLEEWRDTVAKPCSGNSLLILAVSSAFTGPLLKITKQIESGGAGIHFMGDSSQGKTTALQVAGSVWGAPGFVRTWRATSNGLEATAAALNDTLLILDEISECNPKDIGEIVYSLSNGVGKQRAKRTGGARAAAHWRIITLSSGERTLADHMAEAGKHVKAGQNARFLDIPATGQKYGLFNTLHGRADGRVFADGLKQATGACYGHAGPAFVDALIREDRDLPALFALTCEIPRLAGEDGLDGRAASMFALIGMAGELATEYGLTSWSEGEAMEAAIWGYEAWRDYRGLGQTENRQILQSIEEFIQLHGDSRFSRIPDKSSNVQHRAGYWEDTQEGRVYLFNSPGLREAGHGFGIKRILIALKEEGWIVEHDVGRNSKKVRVAGSSVSLYAIRPRGDL